ncbi:transporter substrate-binding domain-containing protein [Desulfosediminicola flagellatus]|uniref:transporter substrate-binding domain-containing protein n=1 Tax=Desulfosediminicola flagellatus TaxID=2569541 RepID=UPI001C3D4623|nr:transporter substrate-binding domain-containing protein [Desulfosediminicola flagellatus]
MRERLTITCFTLVMFMMLAATQLHASTATSTNTLETIKNSGTLKVAVPQDFPPFGSVGRDMKPIGYDIDMAQLIATQLGVKLKLVPVTSTNRIPYLTTGKVDIIISSLGKNPDRQKVIDFTDAYAPFYNGVFGPASLNVEKAIDLSNTTIAVTRGSIEDLELTKIAPESATIRRFEDNSSTISAYLSEQVELVATGNVVAASINEQNPRKVLESKFLIKNSPCYIGINKAQPALMAELNAILAAAKTNGSLETISQEWLHIKLPENL